MALTLTFSYLYFSLFIVLKQWLMKDGLRVPESWRPGVGGGKGAVGWTKTTEK